MAKKRYPGTNALVEVDPAGASAFTAIGVIRNFTPPPKVRAIIDLTGLEDSSAYSVPGIEEPSEFNFENVWDPNDAQDTSLDTLFGNQVTANWRVTVTDGTTQATMTFLGKVQGLTPSTVTGTDGVLRQCQVLRQGDIAYAEVTPP